MLQLLAIACIVLSAANYFYALRASTARSRNLVPVSKEIEKAGDAAADQIIRELEQRHPQTRVALLSRKPGRLVARLTSTDGSTKIAKVATSSSSRAASGLFAEAQSLSFLGGASPKSAPALSSVMLLSAGRPCLLREDAAGNDLHRQIASVADAGAWPSRGQALTAAVAAARVVADLHRNDLVHGDIKPANFIFNFRSPLSIEFNAQPVVVDFDSAQFMTSSVAIAKAGTIGFSAPERYFASHALAQSDVYSLGALTTFLFTGRPGLRPTNDRLPVDVQRVVLTAMNDDPFVRHESAAAFADDLASVARALPSSYRSRALDWPTNWREAIAPELTTTIYFAESTRHGSRVPSETGSHAALAIDELLRSALAPRDHEFVVQFLLNRQPLSTFAEAEGISQKDAGRVLRRAIRSVQKEVQDEASKFWAPPDN